MLESQNKKENQKSKIIYIWVLLPLATSLFIFSARNKNEKPEPTAKVSGPPANAPAQTRPAPLKTAAVKTQTLAQKKKKPEEDILENDPSQVCWNEIYDKAIKDCGQWACVEKELAKKDSEAAKFMGDGWIPSKDGASTHPSPKQRTTYGRFIYALTQIGLATANPNISADEAAGVAALQKLAGKEPNNGLYPFFLSVYYSNKSQKNNAREFLRRALAPEMHFNSHKQEIEREIYLNNPRAQAASLMASAVVARMPVPEYTGWKELLADNADLMGAFGEKMLDGAIQNPVPQMPFEWEPLMAALGIWAHRQAGGNDISNEDWRKMLESSRINTYGHTGNQDCRIVTGNYMKLLQNYETSSL